MVWQGEDWSCGESMDQSLKGFIMCGGPKKWNILLCEVKQRSCNGGEVLNKPSIKISETQESLDMLDSTWNRPICNAFDLSRVHTYLSFRNDDAKVFNRRLHERALFWF